MKKAYYYILYTNGLYANNADGSIHTGWHVEKAIPFDLDPESSDDYPGKEFIEKINKDYDKKESFPFSTDSVYVKQNGGPDKAEYVVYVKTDNRQLAIGMAVNKVISAMQLVEKERVKKAKEDSDKFGKLFDDMLSSDLFGKGGRKH